METTENLVPKSSRQNPLTFYLRTLLYMFMALVMRVVAFLPLGALLLFPEGSNWRWLALLCPILLIFFILPLRFSFANALVQVGRERRFSFDKATGAQLYGEKLAESLLHALHILLWSLPLLVMGGLLFYGIYMMDLKSALDFVDAIGAQVMIILTTVGNFFTGIFGAAAVVPNGGIAEGLLTIEIALAIGLLILAWGVMRNSAFRYIWAYANRVEKNPHAEARRRLRGRRWSQFWVAMINLVLWVPAGFVVFTSLKGMLGDVSEALSAALLTHQLSLPNLTNTLNPLIFAFLVCYMPLLPVRRILTALFATKQLRHQPTDEPATDADYGVVTTSSGAPVPESAVTSTNGAGYVPPVSVGQVYTPETRPEISKPLAETQPIPQNLWTEPSSEPDTKPLTVQPDVRPMPVYTPVHAETVATSPVSQDKITEVEPTFIAADAIVNEPVTADFEPETTVAEPETMKVEPAQPEQIKTDASATSYSSEPFGMPGQTEQKPYAMNPFEEEEPEIPVEPTIASDVADEVDDDRHAGE